MGPSKKNRFSTRAFISAITAMAFTASAFTGLMLFVTPPGRIAYWTNWTIFGLGKDQWSTVHIWFNLVFLIAAAFHIYLNFRLLVTYFKSRITAAFALRTEWILALAICVVVFAGTYLYVKPFSSLIEFNESVKKSWQDPATEAPFPNAEKFSLSQIAQKTNQNAETMTANLKTAGLSRIDPDTAIKELAEANNISPSTLYQIAIGNPNEEADY